MVSAKIIPPRGGLHSQAPTAFAVAQARRPPLGWKSRKPAPAPPETVKNAPFGGVRKNRTSPPALAPCGFANSVSGSVGDEQYPRQPLGERLAVHSGVDGGDVVEEAVRVRLRPIEDRLDHGRRELFPGAPVYRVDHALQRVGRRAGRVRRRRPRRRRRRTAGGQHLVPRPGRLVAEPVPHVGLPHAQAQRHERGEHLGRLLRVVRPLALDADRGIRRPRAVVEGHDRHHQIALQRLGELRRVAGLDVVPHQIVDLPQRVGAAAGRLRGQSLAEDRDRHFLVHILDQILEYLGSAPRLRVADEVDRHSLRDQRRGVRGDVGHGPAEDVDLILRRVGAVAADPDGRAVGLNETRPILQRQRLCRNSKVSRRQTSRSTSCAAASASQISAAGRLDIMVSLGLL